MYDEGFRVLIILLLIPFLIVGFKAFLAYMTVDEITAKVLDKERIITSGGHSSYYLVFTDKETFMNADCWFRLKFNSSDLQGFIQRGKVYKFVVYGFRIPFLSKYRNILKVTELKRENESK